MPKSVERRAADPPAGRCAGAASAPDVGLARAVTHRDGNVETLRQVLRGVRRARSRRDHVPLARRRRGVRVARDGPVSLAGAAARTWTCSCAAGSSRAPTAWVTDCPRTAYVVLFACRVSRVRGERAPKTWPASDSASTASPKSVATPVALTPAALKHVDASGKKAPHKKAPKKQAEEARSRRVAPEEEDRRGRARGDHDRHAPRLDRPDGVRRSRRRPGRHRLVRRRGRSTTRCSAGTPSTTAGRCSTFHPMYTYSQIHSDNSYGGGGSSARQGARTSRRTQGSDTMAHYTHGLKDFADAAERVGAGQRCELQDRRLRRRLFSYPTGGGGTTGAGDDQGRARERQAGRDRRCASAWASGMKAKASLTDATDNDSTGAGQGQPRDPRGRLRPGRPLDPELVGHRLRLQGLRTAVLAGRRRTTSTRLT